jgi:DnaD/phage-associated family protein
MIFEENRQMEGFSGFPDGKHKMISIPSLFFSELLPRIDHLGELRITLYAFWALTQQEGQQRYLRASELLQDQLLLKSLSPKPLQSPQQALQEALEQALARGTLLAVRLAFANGEDTLYFMNTERGRATVRALEAGDWVPGDQLRPIRLIFERPSLFQLYEQNIGAITPIIAEQLKDLEQDYSLGWVEEAIREARLKNITNLNYIINTLKRWKGEGLPPSRQKQKDDDFWDYIQQEYKDLINK